MRYLLLTALIVAGSGLAACDTLGPLFGSYQNKILNQVSANAAGAYTMNLIHDGRIVHTQSWTCKAVEGKLPVCHLDGARTLSTEVSSPPVPVQ